MLHSTLPFSFTLGGWKNVIVTIKYELHSSSYQAIVMVILFVKKIYTVIATM